MQDPTLIDHLNEVFVQVEAALQDLNYGVEADVEIQETGDLVSYEKRGKVWRLCMSDGTGTRVLIEVGYIKRIAAAAVLPELWRRIQMQHAANVARTNAVLEIAKNTLAQIVAAKGAT